MKFNFFYILIIMFIHCAEDIETVQPYNSISQFDSDSSLSIITWNIEWFPKDTNTINYMAQIIIDLNADIFALQEITNSDDFNLLVSEINKLDNDNIWIGYRSSESNYQELAYIIKSNSIIIINNPYEILKSYSSTFAFREPYVLEFKYMNENFILFNNHYKCCGDGILEYDSDDEEYIRMRSNILIEEYIANNFDNDNIILVGDFNDDLMDTNINNVFNIFINQPSKYKFVDIEIASGPSINWSYPSWPSHLDHILISNELFDEFENSESKVETIMAELFFLRGWIDYDSFISDHRPVGIIIKIN